MTKLTKENIETRIMLYVDNELSAGEVRDLMAYLEKHPEYKAMLSDYQYSVLPPEEMVFAHKEQLLKPQNLKAFSLKMTIGIAAAIALIFTITGYYQWMKNDGILANGQNGVAVHSTDSSNREPAMATDFDKNNRKQEMVRNTKPTKGTGGVQNIAFTHVHSCVQSRRKNNLGAIRPVSVVPMVAFATEQRPAAVLVKPENRNFGRQDQRTIQEPIMVHQPKDGLVAEQIATIYEQSDRLKGIHSLVAELDERKNRAVDAWQQIKTTNVILKIGSKEIVIK